MEMFLRSMQAALMACLAFAAALAGGAADALAGL
jgi:hypothetical protein